VDATTETITAGRWAERAGALAQEGWWLADLCGLDRLGLGGSTRFEAVVQLLHHARRERMTVHIGAVGDPPTVPSVVTVWPSASAMEREAYDMYGIRFDGHPELTRILMPDEWEGHPQRKDYGVGKVPVEFVPQPFLQIDAPGQAPQGEEAGREVDELGQGGAPRRGLAGSESFPPRSGTSAPKGGRR
jgi:NADH:ubiquinone oxidoreductase subunit C